MRYFCYLVVVAMIFGAALTSCKDDDDKPKEFTVSFETGEGGSIVAPQKVKEGGKATKPEDPTRTDYQFVEWYKEAGLINEWEFDTDVVTKDITLYAKWEQNMYTVSFETGDDGSTVTPQKVKEGGKVTKPENPTRSGYGFVAWYKENDLINEWNFEIDVVTTDITLYAKWEKNRYSITVSSEGNGIASANVTSAAEGELITLTATANNGYRFVEWQVIEGSIILSSTTDNPAKFIMRDKTVEVKAIFEIDKPTYTITVSSEGNGTASANVTSAAEGELITLTATANNDYRFAEWQVIGGGITLSGTTDNPATFIMTDKAVEVKAIFEIDKPTYTITVSSEGNGKASANVTSAAEGELITLTAIANNGYRFDEWQVIEGGITFYTMENPATFIMTDKAVVVKAIFVQLDWLLGAISLLRSNWDYPDNSWYNYDSQNRITQYYRNYITFMDYNAEGDLITYQQSMGQGKGGQATFSKNDNKITFNNFIRPAFGASSELNGELELNDQGLPVKLTSEYVSRYVDSGVLSYEYWTYTDILLTWQNGNLTKINWKKEDENGSSAGTKTYTHDNKKTPFYNCNTPKWALWWLDYYGHNKNYGYNENNIKTETMEDGSTRTYEYTYNDDGFPVKRTWVDETITYTETYTYK